MKFNHLNVPDSWRHYWTKYPEGYTVMEALISWVSQVDGMVDNVNNWNSYLDDFKAQFDTELQTTVTDILEDWNTSGFLKVIIDEALQTQMDTLEDETNSKLGDFELDLLKSVKHGENESVTVAMLAQDVKTALNGGTWTVNVNTDDIEEDAITPEKTDFTSELKTLSTIGVNVGRFVEATGLLGGGGIYDTTDFQPVKAGKQWIVSEARSIGFYDSTDEVVDVYYPSALTQNATGVVPTGATQWRVSYPTGKPPKARLYNSKNRDIIIDDLTVLSSQVDFQEGDIPATATNFAIEIKTVPVYPTNAGRVVSVNGTLDGSGGYYDTTNFLNLSAGEWFIEAFRSVGFYDNNNASISTVYPSGLQTNASFTVPEGAKTRISYPAGKPPKFYPINRETPEVFIPNLVSAQSDEVLVFLPKEIPVAVGRTIEIYHRQVVWAGNLNDYHFKWECAIGRPLKRKFSIEGKTVGSHNLTLTVFDNNMRQVATATTTVKVVSATTTPKTIVQIGDSLTNTTSTPKPTFTELRRLSNNALSFAGTRGTVSGEKHEGRSGWSASSYLTSSAYTFESEGVHPFWDGTRFNWSHYKTQTGIAPTEVTLFLGTNGIQLNPDTNAGNIKRIVDYIRQDDATIPINVVYTLFRGNQDGIGYQTGSDGYTANKGNWKLEEDRKVFNLIMKLNDLLKDYSNLYFIPIAQCHDSEYNFGSVERQVNPRATQTEHTPSEATHPQEQGYLQMADIMYSVYCSHQKGLSLWN